MKLNKLKGIGNFQVLITNGIISASYVAIKNETN